MYFKRNGKLVTASTKSEAISKIIASDIPNRVIANDGNIRELVEEGIKKYGNKADLNYIDVSNVTNMRELFSHSKFFNGDISKWNVSNVKDMFGMFFKSKFNGDISKWDVSNVLNMDLMFSYSKFNGDISQWNVSNVKSMQGMFSNSKFNGDISKWNVSKVTNMKYMFDGSPLAKNPPKWFKK